MSDFTAGAGEVYIACKTLFEDLNRLANDFGLAIRKAGINLPSDEQYSYGPNTLVLKTDNAWTSYRLDGTSFAFAATYVILDTSADHFKVGPLGRPEIWFLLGRGTKTKQNIAAAVRDIFRPAERGHFSQPLAVNGTVARYDYDKDGEVWSTVLVGFELGEIDSPDSLERLAVSPLRAAAVAHSIQL